MGKRSDVRIALSRGVAALLATAVVFTTSRSAMSAPADAFSSPAPVIGSDPPKAAELRAGEAGVSTQTGAAQYSFPVTLPPGRGGMVPHVSLAYSSQAPLYGTIASGWSLSIPAILEDTSQGRLRTHAPEVEDNQTTMDALLDDRFISTMAGNRPLIPVKEPSGTGVAQTYRAQNDSSFARYERLISISPFPPYLWRVYTTSGTVMTFAEYARMGGCPIGPGYAPLTGEMDPFGNEIQYWYEWVAKQQECRIQKITWGMNANAGVGAIAQVVFGWSEGSHTGAFYAGAQRSYRTGPVQVTGSSRLDTITATAFPSGTPGSPDHTRLITLAYDTSAEANIAPISHAPYRLLKSITESAWRTGQAHVVLPPVTFQYGAPMTSLSQASSSPPWLVIPGSPGSEAGRTKNLGWGFRHPNDDRWPSVEAMMIDLDGDGLLDRLVNTSNGTNNCSATWQRNKGPDPANPSNLLFEPTLRPLTLPRLKWGGVTAGVATPGPTASAPWREGCSLNGQATAYFNSNGNTPIANSCHDGAPCQASTDPDRAGLKFCNRVNPPTSYGKSGTVCPPDAGGGGTTGYKTYLAYRWMDADGDGLTDLVTAIHGDSDTYDVEMGGLTGLESPEAPFNLGTWPACPGIQICKELGACLGEAAACPANTVCPTNWTDVNSCLNSSPAKACFSITARMPPAVINGPVQRAPYTRCEGLYPWFIYKNQGNGVFKTTPVVKYQPVPLESDGGDSGIGGPSIFAENHAVTDFDGDGWLDGIAHGEENINGDPNAWYVWLGDGTGGMGPKRYFFPTRSHANDSNRIAASDPATLTGQRMGTFDINGDGLPDHWLAVSNGAANITFHDGTSFEVWSTTGPDIQGEVTTPAGVKPSVAAVSVPYPIDPLGNGVSTATSRVFDVDNDGRPDIVKILSPDSALVYYNLGGQFLSAGSAYPTGPGAVLGLMRKVKGRDTTIDSPNDLPETRTWQLNSDMMDLDGDGIAEPVSVEETTPLLRGLRPSVPPRLLTQIDNGRGARSIITYATMHDTAVVEQNPQMTGKPSLGGTGWFDGLPKSTPVAQWVVKKIQVDDDYDSFTGANGGTVTSYVYRNPRHGPDDANHYAFRGFETVETTSQSGARTIQTYGYDVDWSGRLVKTVVVSAERPTGAVSVDKTNYTALTLFPLAVTPLTTFHVASSEHFVCSDTQNEAQCTSSASAPVVYTRTELAYAKKQSDTAPGTDLMWVQTTSRTKHALANADNDRVSTQTYFLAANASTYRLRSDTSTSQVQLAGTLVTYAKSRTTWDPAAPAYARKVTDEVWVDNVDANRSITRYNYEDTTGNLREVTSPRGFITGYEYDARKLFVAFVNTPIFPHDVEYDYEYGTGKLLETRGPNVDSCVFSQNCTPGLLTRDASKVVVDGLGRTLERWASVNVNPTQQAYFQLKKMETWSYVDTPPSSTIPSSVTHQAAVKEVSNVVSYVQDKTELDGHGRPKRTITATGGTDAITTYDYRLDGTVQSVLVPHPTTTTTATVLYSYTFDSLGRPMSIRRPDAPATGIDMFYESSASTGVRATTKEVTSTGKIAEVRRTMDADGRLAKVEEKSAENAGAPVWAATVYAYDAANNVVKITDAEGKITSLAHDLAGHRTSVDRNGRKWEYQYDKSGNVESEISPCTPQPTCRSAFTTTVVYDALDRVSTRYIAPRTLTSTDLDLFGASQETFTWDSGANGRGRLTQWRNNGPSGGIRQRQQFNYDPEGRVIFNYAEFATAGYNTSRSVGQSYYLGGRPDLTAYYDYVQGGSVYTASEMEYDPAGRPLKTWISTNGMQSWQPPIVETRTVAGTVTKRRVDFPLTPTPPMSYVQSAWTYDILGRVTGQTVSKLDTSVTRGTVQVAKQALTYFGNDDVSTLTTSLGTSQATQTYTFDYRHQLTDVVSVPSTFGAAYHYSEAGRFTQATVTQAVAPASPSEVKPRDVFYNYAGNDPELVTSLNSGGFTGPAYMTYTYDEAGNQLTRTESATGDVWTFQYDGKDQLRRASKKHNNVVTGSEEYWYDSSGSRSQVLKRDGAGAVTEMVWFHGGTEAHYDAAGTVTFAYVHVAMGTPVARINRTAATTTSTEYQFHGLAGSTLAAVDTNGTINASFSYAPFGEVIESTNGGGGRAGTAVHKRLWNDKQRDDLTDLSYYGARYYDRTLMGWTQIDPLYLRIPDLGKQSTPRRSNLAVFSLNNPIRYVDPDGLDATSGYLPSMSGFSVAPSEAFNADVARRQSGDGGYVGSDCSHFSWRCHWGFYQGGGASSSSSSFPICHGGRGYCGSGAPEDLSPEQKKLVRKFTSHSAEDDRALLAMAALAAGQPKLAFVLAMSAAAGEDDIALPIVFFGLGEVLGVAKANTKGTATVLEHEGGHASIIVRHGDEVLHTEQIVLDAESKATTIQVVSDAAPVVRSVTVELPDAAAAMRYQGRVLGTPMGKYNPLLNSCVTHCGEVLVEGGIEGLRVTTLSIIRWLNKQ